MFSDPLSFLLVLDELPDPRQDAKVLYPLPEMVFLAMCGAVANCDSWTDIQQYADDHEEFFQKYLPLENGVPSHDTFSRVFSRLDPVAFSECLIKWVDALQLDMQGQGVHLDGKTLRRSFDAAASKDALQVVTAWAGDLHLCLGQLPVEEGSNERTAVPELLRLLELKGAIVTLDAMHCQKSTARQIREKQADYVLTVKQNQPKLFKLINDTFEHHGHDGYRNSKLRRHTTSDGNARRTYTVFPAPNALRQMGWQDIKAIGMVYRERTVNGRTTEQLVYFISSLPPKVRTIAKHLRNHWKIENQLHWSLDVTFAEDTSRIRKKDGPANAAIFRRLALSIVKRDESEKLSMRAKRLKASWRSEHLLRYLTGKQA